MTAPQIICLAVALAGLLALVKLAVDAGTWRHRRGGGRRG